VFPLSYSIYKTKSDLNRNTLLGSALTLLGVAIIVFR
jgi:hypothetical protein